LLAGARDEFKAELPVLHLDEDAEIGALFYFV
jgi:hypothetical protein